MTVRGKVKNGKVVLAKARAFPEGTEAEVRRAKARKIPAKKAKPGKPKARPRSLADRLRNLIGNAQNLPPIMTTIFTACRNKNEARLCGHRIFPGARQSRGSLA